MDRHERNMERRKIWQDWFLKLSSDKEELRKQLEKAGFFESLNEEEEEFYDDDKLYFTSPIYYDYDEEKIIKANN